jgi:hypothetical protein
VTMRVRDERGILPEVWEDRPYVRWTTEDIFPVLKGYAGLNQYQRAFMTRMAKQSPGWSITRHPVPGAPPIYPEIRPDNAVETRSPTRHWHGAGEPPEEPGIEVIVRGTKAWADHCRRINEDPKHPDKHHELRQDVHEHKNEAKYVFPSSAYVDEPWDHDHSAKKYEDPVALLRHLEHYHQEPPEPLENGKHRHWRRVKDHSDSLARRLDVHRMAWERFAETDRVYFGIEGCLKADSILSAIIREGRNESVFSVPSVSLWAAPELDSFLK